MQAVRVAVRDTAGIDEAALAQREDELALHGGAGFYDLLVRPPVTRRHRVEHQLREEGGERVRERIVRPRHVCRDAAAERCNRISKRRADHIFPRHAVEVVAGVALHIGAGRRARGRVERVLDHGQSLLTARWPNARAGELIAEDFAGELADQVRGLRPEGVAAQEDALARHHRIGGGVDEAAAELRTAVVSLQG